MVEKKLIICLKTFNLQDGKDVALYTVADKDTRSIDPVRNSLTRVGEKMQALQGSILPNIGSALIFILVRGVKVTIT